MLTTAARPPRATGVDIIDEQHQAIFRMVLDFMDAFENDERASLLVEKLSEIYQYVKIHFATEESIIERYEPRRLEDHKQVHDRTLEELREHILDYKRNGRRIRSRVLDRLQMFVGVHMDGTDVELLSHLAERIRQENAQLLAGDDR